MWELRLTAPESWSEEECLSHVHQKGLDIEQVVIQNHQNQQVLSWYGEDPSPLELVLKRFAEEAVFGAQLLVCDEHAWQSAWKDHVQPFALGEMFWVQPAWLPLQEAPSGRQTFVIETTTTFGLGDHPTTQLMVEFLEAYAPLHGSVLDVGTGTGLLAMVAHRLGAGHVDAFDYDSEAVERARHNIQINLSPHIECQATDLFQSPWADRRYDYVLANVLSYDLQQAVSILKQWLKPKGLLIVSGISHVHRQPTQNVFEAAGLIAVRSQTKSDWVAQAYQLAGTI